MPVDAEPGEGDVGGGDAELKRVSLVESMESSLERDMDKNLKV